MEGRTLDRFGARDAASGAAPLRCLVLRAGAIGDGALAFPLLHALKASRPRLRLTLAGRTEVRFLAREAGLADEVEDIAGLRFMPLFAEGPARDPELSAWIAGFDLVVSLLGDPAGSFAARLTAFGARTLAAFRTIAPGASVARQLFDVARGLGLTAFPDDRPLVVLDRAPPFALPDRFVVFHVGSGSGSKNWGVERYRVLAAEAIAAGCGIVLPRGEADAEPVARVAEGLGERCRVVELGLVDLAAVMARARLYVGNDSGITHIAGLLGIPTVAIFGSTDPVLWRPVGPRVFIAGGEAGFPDVAAVRRAAVPFL